MLTREQLQEISAHVEEALQGSITEPDGLLHRLLEQTTLEIVRRMRCEADETSRAA